MSSATSSARSATRWSSSSTAKSSTRSAARWSTWLTARERACSRWSRTCAASTRRNSLSEQAFEEGHVHRLQQGVVDACSLRALAILLLAASGDGDDLERGQSRLAPERCGDLEAVGSGKPDVQQHEVRSRAARDEERRADR